MSVNLEQDKRAERKTLLTVAEWLIPGEPEYQALTPAEQSALASIYLLDRSADAYIYSNDEYVMLPHTSTGAGQLYAASTAYILVDTAETKRELLGVRTEDSAIEFNADIETITDILGITYSDINKTEPQQTFDPFYVMGGSNLSAYLNECLLANRFEDYSNFFTVYLIALYDTPAEGTAYAVRHTNCSIIPTAIGGSAYVNMPLEVHYSNIITEGSVDLDENGKFYLDFEFTEA